MALDKVVDSAALHADLVGIADSIRAKGGTSAQFASAAEMKAAVDAIETGGGSDTIKFTSNQQNAYGMFANLAFEQPDTNLDITFTNRNFNSSGNMEWMFESAKNLSKVKISTGPNIESTSCSSMFYSSGIKEIDVSGLCKTKNAKRMFYSNGHLKTIIGDIDLSISADNTNAFANNGQLETISFAAETIKLSTYFGGCESLSAESIQSIIDGLAAVTSTQTLTMDASAALSEAQKAQITSKNWTLVQ